MVPAVKLTTFEDRAAASSAAAVYLADQLTQKLAVSARASLMVSGGTTPKACLEELSDKKVDWSRVTVMPTDERLVPVSDDASNERMIRRTLIKGKAEDADFCPLMEERVSEVAADLVCALVGMGEDGHFASIFPDNPELQALLDVYTAPACREIQTIASEHRRITANLSLLLSGQSVLLLIFGEEKKEVLGRAEGLPVWHLLNQPCTPVEVYWAP